MHSCSCGTSSPKGIARLLVRIAFGLSLIFLGISHYQDPEFAEAVGRGLGALEPLGMVWGYVLPALYIVGGVLLTLGLFMNVAAWTAGVALVSVPAGLLLKSVFGINLNDTMPLALNGWIWVIVFMYAVKGTMCECGDACACCDDEKPPLAKQTVSKPAVVKAPAKKAAPKKK